jgi:hypothetical protein
VTARAVIVFAVAALAGCHTPQAASSSSDEDLARYLKDHPEAAANSDVPAYDYYTGSDAKCDYYVILDGPGGKEHRIACDRDPKAWPNPMPPTQDQTQWRLVPGSSVP